MLSLVALGLLAGQAVNAIPTITAKGSKFFTSDGNQFYLKGTLVFTKITCLDMSALHCTD